MNSVVGAGLSDADARPARRDVARASGTAASLQRVFYASLASNNVFLPLSALRVSIIGLSDNVRLRSSLT